MIRRVLVYTPWSVYALHLDEVDHGKLSNAFRSASGTVDVTDENGIQLEVRGEHIMCMLSTEVTGRPTETMTPGGTRETNLAA